MAKRKTVQITIEAPAPLARAITAYADERGIVEGTPAAALALIEQGLALVRGRTRAAEATNSKLTPEQKREFGRRGGLTKAANAAAAARG